MAESPTPEPRDDRTIVFYDGGCGLCHKTVLYLIEEDARGQHFRFAPIEGETFLERVPEDQREGLPDSVVLLEPDGRVRVKSDAMLSALELPPEKGETEFADMRAAFDELSPQMQTKLQGLQAYHSLYYSQERAGYTHTTDNMYGLHDKGAPLRDVIKVHPETGRKSIYTGRHAYGIPGFPEAESEALLDKLMADACQPPRVYTHTWTVGDTVVWDNRCMMHRARPYDKKYPRVLRGTRISGDPASELAQTFADARAAAFRPSQSNTSASS